MDVDQYDEGNMTTTYVENEIMEEIQRLKNSSKKYRHEKIM